MTGAGRKRDAYGSPHMRELSTLEHGYRSPARLPADKKQGANHAWNDTGHHPDLAADRCHPALGLQLRLGLRTIWHCRYIADPRDRFGVERTNVSAIRSLSASPRPPVV